MVSNDPLGYYAVLGVSPNDSDETIKKKYRNLALKWHPDKHQGDKDRATEMFKKISEAYQVLSDKKSRNRYDATGTVDDMDGGFNYTKRHHDFDFADAQRVFNMVFGGNSPFGLFFGGDDNFFQHGSSKSYSRRHDIFDDMFDDFGHSSMFNDHIQSFVSQSFSSGSSRNFTSSSTSTTTRVVNNKVFVRKEITTTHPDGSVTKQVIEEERPIQSSGSNNRITRNNNMSHLTSDRKTLRR